MPTLRSNSAPKGPITTSQALEPWHHDALSDQHAHVRARLRKDARNGVLCGVGLTGPYVDAFFALLDHLGWTPSYDALSGAMPHLPEDFGPDTMREVLARLGYPSYTTRRRISDLSTTQLPALILDAAPQLVVDRGQGVQVVDPVDGSARSHRSRLPRNVLCFGDAEQMRRHGSSSWFGETIGHLRPTMGWLLALTFAINSLILLTSLAVMAIYDLVLPTSAYDTLVAILIGALLVIAFDLTLRRIRARFMGHLAGRLEYVLGTALLSKVLSLPVARLTSVPAIGQVNRLKQFEAIRDNIAGQFAVVMMELPFALVFSLVLMALVGPVGAIPLGLVLVLGTAGLLLLPIARRRSIAAQNTRAAYNDLFLDMLANLPTLRNLGCEDIWGRRLDAAAVEAARTRGRVVEMGRVIAAVSGIAAPLAGGATVAIGALQVLEGDMSTGALVTCMLVVWRIITPVQQALMLVPRLPVLMRLARQVDILMALPGEDEARAGTLMLPPSQAGHVTLRQVTFRYAGTSLPAIAGLDLDVQAGEFLAVTGASGSGKSTLLNLMQGLLTPQAGIITLDGRNLRQMPLPEVRTAISLVRQEPQFFHGTILQNLRLGAPMASVSEMEALLDELGLLSTVRLLPDGLDTHLTETKHSELSQGTRQTLALCRGLLRKPRVLLLDEPARALDSSLDQALVDAITARIGKMTMVMVSHRPSHIELADRMLRLDQGRIAELKTFQKP